MERGWKRERSRVGEKWWEEEEESGVGGEWVGE